MKKLDYRIKSLALFSLICLCLTACKIDEIETYHSKRALFFPRVHPENSQLIIDSVFVSFSHYQGKDELQVPFTISLVGPLLKQDLEYVVTIDQEKTTAQKIDYVLPEKCLFRKGMIRDTLWVTIKKANLKDDDYLLVMRVEANENFSVGYYNRQVAKLAFNNIISQPGWWDKQITEVFFGAYSYKKLTTIIDAAKEAGIEFVGTEEMPLSEIRKIALIAKYYIAKNGITEDNGDEMIIVVY